MRSRFGCTALGVILWVFWLCPCFASDAPQNDGCEQQVSAADQLARAGKIPNAVIELRKAVQLCPKAASVHIQLGRLLARTGDLNSALSEFKLATQVAPGDASAYGNLGLAELVAKHYDAAESNLSRAAELAPADTSILFALFEAQLALHQFNEGAMTAERIEKLSPQLAGVYDRIATVQARSGDFAHAAANFEQSVELDPNSETARYNAALANLRAGMAQRALSVLAPLNNARAGAEVTSLLGEIYEACGMRDKALDALRRAAEKEPGNEDYQFDYVVELMRAKDFNSSQSVCERVFPQFPHSLRLQLAYGIALFGSEQYVRASQSLLHTAEQFPDSQLALRVLVLSAEVNRAELTRTESVVSNYLHAHPENASANYLLARLLLLRNEARQAVVLLRKSVAIVPTNADYWLLLGKAEELSGNKQNAAIALKKATMLKPERSEAWYRLARVLKSLRREEDAKLAFLRFRETRSKENAENPVTSLLQDLH